MLPKDMFVQTRRKKHIGTEQERQNIAVREVLKSFYHEFVFDPLTLPMEVHSVDSRRTR